MRINLFERSDTWEGEGKRSALYMVQTLISEKIFQNSKKFQKNKIFKIEKEKIWIFVIFVLPLHCVFHGN